MQEMDLNPIIYIVLNRIKIIYLTLRNIMLLAQNLLKVQNTILYIHLFDIPLLQLLLSFNQLL